MGIIKLYCFFCLFEKPISFFPLNQLQGPDLPFQIVAFLVDQIHIFTAEIVLLLLFLLKYLDHLFFLLQGEDSVCHALQKDDYQIDNHIYRNAKIRYCRMGKYLHPTKHFAASLPPMENKACHISHY